MSILNLETMSTSEKFMALEELWADMSKNVNSDELTPQWHLDILSELDEKEKNKELKFSDFNEAKKRLQTLIKK